MQNVANLLRSIRVSKTVLLFIASSDWETVKNVVPGNSSSKPDQLGGKVLNSHLMLNYSVLFLID